MFSDKACWDQKCSRGKNTHSVQHRILFLCMGNQNKECIDHNFVPAIQYNIGIDQAKNNYQNVIFTLISTLTNLIGNPHHVKIWMYSKL